MSQLHLLIILVCFLSGNHTAEILAVFQSPGRSQWVLAEEYLKGLLGRGHQITVFTTFPASGSPANWTEVILPNPRISEDDGDLYKMHEKNSFEELFEIFPYGEKLCETFLNNEDIQNLLKSRKKFDLVVMEIFFTECVMGFAYKMNSPVVAIASFAPADWMSDIVGNPNPYSYIPHPFLPYTCHMNFFERLKNTIVGMVGRAVHYFYFLPRLDAIMQKYLKDDRLLSLSEIVKQTSLLLVNHHSSIGCPRPMVPNMVEVGGMHVKKPRKLPLDLQKFLDDSKYGAIYFSMGSNANSSLMPIEKRTVFLNVFSKLKQQVLWKWEEDVLPGKPPNVKTGKWLPQPDILAHKNIKTFITHGGLLSTLEATAHGVPLIGIPLFGDQELNMIQAEKQGYAIKLEFNNISEQSLEWAINEILTDQRYQENAKSLSKRFNDRPQPPLEEAIYWTEYVIRYNGAPHLRSAALDLTWYQYFLIDIIVVVLVAFLSLIVIICQVLRTLWRLLRSNDAAKKPTEKRRKLLKKD